MEFLTNAVARLDLPLNVISLESKFYLQEGQVSKWTIVLDPFGIPGDQYTGSLRLYRVIWYRGYVQLVDF